MTRAAAAALVVLALALVGCGSRAARSGPLAQPDAGRGPIDSRARTLPATNHCDDGAPPIPLIRAERTETRIKIEYELLARPGGCKPEAIHITANSVDKLDNIAPARGGGGPIRLTGRRDVVELKLPPLDLPPYEARASTYTEHGRRSATTTVPVPEAGRYCRRTQGAAVCIARARAKFTRCLRGKAPRAACPDYVWNARPLIPYEPLVGVTREKLEQSFAFVAGREGNDPPHRHRVLPFDTLVHRNLARLRQHLSGALRGERLRLESGLLDGGAPRDPRGDAAETQVQRAAPPRDLGA